METFPARSSGLKVQEASCTGTRTPTRTFDPVPRCHKSGSWDASAPSAFNRLWDSWETTKRLQGTGVKSRDAEDGLPRLPGLVTLELPNCSILQFPHLFSGIIPTMLQGLFKSLVE